MSELMIELADVILDVMPDAPAKGIISAIHLRFGGQLLYVPKISLKDRDNQIKGLFERGESINQLCRKFDLSNQQIRRVLAK